MSTIYRTLLMVYKNCEEWNAESGPDGIDFLQIQWIDCDGLTQGITLYPIDGLYAFCVKSGTSPTIVAFNGAFTLEPTGNICALPSIQVDFLTKTTDPGNILNLTTDTCNSFGFNTTSNVLRIFTTSTNYKVEVYNGGILYQTFNSLSGDTINTITNTAGTFTYFVKGEVGMTFTSQIDFAFISTPPPQSNSVTGYNTTGQTI